MAMQCFEQVLEDYECFVPASCGAGSERCAEDSFSLFGQIRVKEYVQNSKPRDPFAEPTS